MKINYGEVALWVQKPQKLYSLRGGAELRNVMTSQIKRETNPDKYYYMENVPKNNNGTFKIITY